MPDQSARANGDVKYFERRVWFAPNREPDLIPTISLVGFEREFSGKRIFMRELLETAAKTIALAREHTPMEDSEHVENTEDACIVVKALRPNQKDFEWKPQPIHSKGITLGWQKYYYMVEAGESARPFRFFCSPRIAADTTITCTNTLSLEDSDLRKRARETPVSDPRCDSFLKTQDAWEATQQWKNLQLKLKAFAGQHRIKNIVCAGLGTLYPRKDPEPDPRCEVWKYYDHHPFYQHLLACSIAKFLGETFPHPDNSTGALQIVAHDPAYTKADLQFLSQLPQPISIVSDPHHYLTITPETLVVGIHVPAPVHEIVADMLYPSGPAAWLCGKIQGDQDWHKEGRLWEYDSWTPRVGEMMALYEMINLRDLGWTDSQLDPWCTRDGWSWLAQQVLYLRKPEKSLEMETSADRLDKCR
ncbi:hypothetical protein SLS60_001736 [Paraconiothyrium brasiliense]|uniref:SRR1-like domain-containing protein n=1 Tax=Paraconiothyrium brasiliense TaxID=300254 RepID=A0ABR3S080_9PLEO